MSIGSDLLDAALKLSEGQKLEVFCKDYKELQVVKVSLYRERKRYEEKAGTAAESICIEQESLMDGAYCVKLSLSPQLSRFRARVVTEDGQAMPVVITRAPSIREPSLQEKEKPSAPISERDRMIALMKEDGLSDEEIEEILGKEEENNGSDNDNGNYQTT